MDLDQRIEKAYTLSQGTGPWDEAMDAFREFMESLDAGRIRAAERKSGKWRVQPWVKKGILLGFRLGTLQDMSINDKFRFFDKHTFPLKKVESADAIRIVPGGSSIRAGAFLGRNVTCMPPMYVNIGAYVDDGTMIDSHVLVGSCAQIGKRVHLSAGSQIGGVLEPVGALPVIIEDDVFVGGLCGIFEGTLVSEGAVIGAGTILTGATPVYDLVHDRVYAKIDDNPLVIPPGAVVVPGSRPISSERGKELGLSLHAPVIVKYRDEKTSKSAKLEDLLR